MFSTPSIGLSCWQSELLEEACNKLNSPHIVKVGDKQRSFPWPAPLHDQCNGGGKTAAERPQASLYKNIFTKAFSIPDSRWWQYGILAVYWISQRCISLFDKKKNHGQLFKTSRELQNAAQRTSHRLSRCQNVLTKRPV